MDAIVAAAAENETALTVIQSLCEMSMIRLPIAPRGTI